MKRFKIDLSEYSVTIQVNKRNEEICKERFSRLEDPGILK